MGGDVGNSAEMKKYNYFILAICLRLHLVAWQAEVENLSLEEHRLDDRIRL